MSSAVPAPIPMLIPVRPQIMGIVNVTPDSFSDGGQFEGVAAAVQHACALMDAGAQIIDVGGESTRPGAERPSASEEQRRVLPVIRELVDRGVRVSVDTMNSSTALAAAELGAAIVNDVSGGLADEDMARVVAETGVQFVAMHWRGHSNVMQENAEYHNVVDDVRGELQQRVAELVAGGVQPDRIILDPGIGFSKTAAQNWQLLANIPSLAALGCPVLIGASRKKFLGEIVNKEIVNDRDAPTAVISALSAQAGAWGVRVHNVAATKAALDVWQAMQP